MGWPRAATRQKGVFKGTPAAIVQELVHEVNLLVLGKEARTHILNNVIISSNVPLGRTGQPIASEMTRALPDPGVALYFTRKGKPVCLACDSYDAVWKNVRALQLTLEAMRGIERWGSTQLLDRAFTGFAALPEKATAETCWNVLGIPSTSDRIAIDTAFRKRAMELHPDLGGTNAEMARLNEARHQALESIAG
jgi:hypothetical protein